MTMNDAIRDKELQAELQWASELKNMKTMRSITTTDFGFTNNAQNEGEPKQSCLIDNWHSKQASMNFQSNSMNKFR